VQRGTPFAGCPPVVWIKSILWTIARGKAVLENALDDLQGIREVKKDI
jgi:hypothetical protein